MDKSDLTTYINGILLALFSYVGISQSAADFYIELLAPFFSIVIAGLVSYFNEKYPSSLVTSVVVEDDEDGL